MRMLHRLRLLALLVLVTVMAIVVHQIHRVQSARSVSHLLQLANKYEAGGEIDRALYYLDMYLIKRPNDMEALQKAARISFDDRLLTTPQGFTRAVDLVENLLSRDVNQSDLRFKLVKAFFDRDLVSNAQSHLDVLKKQQPENGLVNFYLGWIEERNGRFTQAADLYERARKQLPTNIDIFNRLARVYRVRLNERTKADRVMDLPQMANGMVQNNLKNPRAYLARNLYRREFQLPHPEEDIAEALRLAPNDLDVLICAAREAFLGGKPDEARAHLKHAEELFPENAQVYLSQGAVETRTSKFDEAVNVLRRGIAKLPNDVEIQWNLADLLVQLGKTDEALPEIKRLRAMGARREIVELLDNLVIVNRQQWSEAAPPLETLAGELATDPNTVALARRAYLALGRCYSELGNTDLQLSAYTRALQITASLDERQVLQARSGLAAALVDMGRLDEAIDEYRKNLALPSAPADTKVILARLLIFRNLRMQETSRRWEEVEQLLETAAKSLPGSSEVTILQAEQLAAQQKLDPARKLLEKAQKEYPDRPDLWVALAMLAQRQEQPQEAIRVLEAGEARLGDKIEFRLARARLLGIQGGSKASEQLAALERDLDKFSNSQRRELMAGIAEAYSQVGELKTALGFWKRMGDEQPRDLTPRLIQFDMAMQDGLTAEVDRIIGEIQAIEGEDGNIWRYASARLLMGEARREGGDVNKFKSARDLLSQVALKRPAWSRPPLALGEIDDLLGAPNLALRNYLQAIRLGDRSPLVIRRSIEILYQQRRFDLADQVLRQVQEQMPISGELQRMAADISIEQRDYARALKLAKTAISTDSRDYQEHIWLGRLQMIISRRALSEGKREEAAKLQQEAEVHLRRAVELGHEKPDSWVALIQFLVRIDRKVAAEQALSEAEKAITPSEAPLALAQASMGLGNTERTDAYFKKAIELKPDDLVTIQSLVKHYLDTSRLKEAQGYLETLIAQKKSEQEKRWATGILSQLLAMNGSNRQTLRALELLGLLDGAPIDEAKTATEPVDDLRAKVYVLARQKTISRLREAKRLLEEVLQREAPLANDVYLYGHLCEMDGNWPKAREQFQQAVIMAPDNSLFLTEFANALLRHDLPDEAQVPLAKLEKLKPGSLEAVEVKARILAAKSQGAKASAIVLDFVKDKEIPVRYCAELLESIGQNQAAEELFTRFSKQGNQPENLLYLSAFLGRRQRTSEALDLCDQAWAKCKPEDVAATAIQNIYFSDTPEKYYDRVAAKLEEMIKLHPENVPLLFELANVRGIQGKIEEAKSIYLKAYEKNPDNVAPLNNLAWMLAFQPPEGKSALDYINQAIAGYSSVPPLLDTRAVIYMSIGQPELAIRDLEDAIAVDPNASRQLHLAEAYLMGKRKKDAVNALTEAKRLGLNPKSLHPFERKPYETLIGQLGEKSETTTKNL